MTGLLHERQLSRKTFLKGGGALIVGLSLTGAARAFDDPKAASPSHIGGVAGPPDPSQIDTWIAIHADNTASIYTGRVNLGQGTPNGLLMIAGEELDMDLGQLTFVEADSNVTPDTGNTVGSSSITSAGPRVRAGAASAKQVLLGLASAQLGVPVSSLTVRSGVVTGGGRTVTYAQLIGDKVFNAQLTASTLNPGQGVAKPPAKYTLVGTSPPRIDIPDKVTGRFVYAHNIRVPGMLHGRIIRPRGQGAYGTAATLLSVDASSIRNIPNVQIVRRGDFLAVAAPREYDAIQAASQLKVRWKDNPVLPGDGNIVSQLRAQDRAGRMVNTTTVTGNVDAALASAAKVISASFTVDYQMHGPIGPPVAVAIVEPDSAVVITNTQGVYRLRDQYLAPLLRMDSKKIRIQYVEGASAFGHCETDDAACAAAVISQELGGTPVRLQFMRWDDHGWDNYGPTHLSDVRAGIDGKGNIVAYDNSVYVMANTHAQETTHELVGLGSLQNSQLAGGAGPTPTTYNIPNRRAVGKSVPLNGGGYLKVAPLRLPSSPHSFPAEQMIDELAHAAGMDPVAFRLQNLTNQRSIDALTTVAQIAGWKPKVAASQLSDERIVTGRGVALSGTSAAVADVQVDRKTGKILAKHMFGVYDVGLAISPGLVENQMVGAITQTVSRALHEGVRYTKSGVTSTDWVTYPIMRFKEHPSLTNVVIQRLDQLPTGAGEPLVACIPAALANAFFDATGVRIRQVPMTAGRVRAALAEAGVTA
ncbi:MAG TPA: molybdopterin cofactor-binding domain-containing protein [Gaiellaceae bacterium]|nr:molybdopterin cofactor-binding domain-containing protein [Gaiellaceae bacterium]